MLLWLIWVTLPMMLQASQQLLTDTREQSLINLWGALSDLYGIVETGIQRRNISRASIITEYVRDKGYNQVAVEQQLESLKHPDPAYHDAIRAQATTLAGDIALRPKLRKMVPHKTFRVTQSSYAPITQDHFVEMVGLQAEIDTLIFTLFPGKLHGACMNQYGAELIAWAGRANQCQRDRAYDQEMACAQSQLAVLRGLIDQHERGQTLILAGAYWGLLDKAGMGVLEPEAIHLYLNWPFKELCTRTGDVTLRDQLGIYLNSELSAS